MWPMLLDMSQSECKKALRTLGNLLMNYQAIGLDFYLSLDISLFFNLELEAYSIVVSTFRAQGDLTSKKQEILKDLQAILK